MASLVAIRRRQKGAAGIEFAALFVLFFAVFYAIVSYALAMLLLQGFTQAAQEGVRAAIAVDPLSYANDAEYETAVATVARTRAAAALAWLPAKAQREVVQGNRIATTVVGGAVTVVTVTVTYPNYTGNGLVPTLTLPVIGPVPRLPTDLVGQASLQI